MFWAQLTTYGYTRDRQADRHTYRLTDIFDVLSPLINLVLYQGQTDRQTGKAEIKKRQRETKRESKRQREAEELRQRHLYFIFAWSCSTLQVFCLRCYFLFYLDLFVLFCFLVASFYRPPHKITWQSNVKRQKTLTKGIKSDRLTLKGKSLNSSTVTLTYHARPVVKNKNKK